MKGKLQVLGSAVVLAVVVASFGASAALAAGDTSDAFMRAVNTHMQELSAPRPAPPDAFERAVAARMKMLAAATRPVPDAFERALHAHEQALAAGTTSFGERGPDLVERVVSPSASVSGDTGFDWSAAALGGSATLAIVLLLSGGAVAARHQRGRPATR